MPVLEVGVGDAVLRSWEWDWEDARFGSGKCPIWKWEWEAPGIKIGRLRQWANLVNTGGRGCGMRLIFRIKLSFLFGALDEV
jgi:hypothetical protein